MKLWKRLLSLVLCGMMMLGMIGIKTAAQEPLTVRMEPVELAPVQTSAEQLRLFGLDENGNPPLNEGNHVAWIDRVDLSDAPYALSLYNWMEQNCDISTGTGMLIDPTTAEQLGNGEYVYLITTIKGRGQFQYSGNADTDGQNAWNAIVPTLLDNEQEAFSYITAAYSAFDRDHPEVFWLSGQSQMLDQITYGYDIYGRVSFTQYLYFLLKSDSFDIRGTDYRDADGLKATISQLYGVGGTVDTILDGVDARANRYEKVRYFNRWLTMNNHYNVSVNTASQNAFECVSAFTGAYGKDAPVCEGYARAMQVLCDRADIPCVLVDGMAYTGGTRTGHIWNYIAMEDGNWYAVDVTWNDPATGSDSGHVSGCENENYLLVGGKTKIGSMAFLDSHPVSNMVTVNGTSFVNGPVLADTAYDPATAPQPMVIPTLEGTGFSLSFEDEILVNFYYTVSDTTDVAEQGMLVFHTEPGEAAFATADEVYESEYVTASDRYIAITHGIAAKEMGDERYYCAYAKLTDGTYVYSPLYLYSPQKYAMSRIQNSTDESMRALCVAMLNYGAAAQEYFGYRVDDLMNDGLTAAQKALVTAYDESLFAGAVAADTGKAGSFVKTDGYGGKSASVSFEGAFCINYYFAPSGTAAGEMTLYIWDAAAYEAAAYLDVGNASGVISMEQQSGGVYWGQISGIAAKALDDTYYVAGLYNDGDGNPHCTGVIPYSLSQYCMNNAYGSMGQLSQATALYGYYAARYFGK